mmetsp:Transcript_137440/g.274243  ORF Transcript_137440/g.274243 Transcript_137440/m.274243 type:complete len:135 (-) Transcript_137440:705-1109(-)
MFGLLPWVGPSHVKTTQMIWENHFFDSENVRHCQQIIQRHLAHREDLRRSLGGEHHVLRLFSRNGSADRETFLLFFSGTLADVDRDTFRRFDVRGLGDCDCDRHDLCFFFGSWRDGDRDFRCFLLDKLRTGDRD